MTPARETFLKQGQGPGQGAHLRGSLKAVANPILEPSVKDMRRIGPRQVDNFARRASGREWTPVSQH
jgi:hypothetical protein